MTSSRAAGLAVTRYLRPEEAVVPFRNRPELAELLTWCTGRGHAKVRLVTGDGGAGKTRLALRLGQELEANGWQPLWVPRGAEREAVEAIRTLGHPCVLVVDYAETRSDLARLLGDIASNQDGPEVRAMLLARSSGEWWQQLLASVEERTAALLEMHNPLVLGPVRALGGPHEVFAEALTAFANKLKTARPEVRLVLSDTDPVVLVVHAAALLAVADYGAGAATSGHVVSSEAALEGLLRHEAGYWVRSAAGRGLDLDVTVLRLAVAVACLIGADNQTDAMAVLARVPDLDSAEQRGRVARWLHDLYPPPAHENDARKGEWLGPLRPDRLAEQLVAGELAGRPELVGSWFAGLDGLRAARALTVLARAALTQEQVVSLLHAALAAHLDHLAVPALTVAVETNPVLGDLLAQVLRTQPVSRETLRRIADESPDRSFALAMPAAVALKYLADDPADADEHAAALVDLSSRLANLGRREEALEAIEQAVSIYRRLIHDQPFPFLAGLATALNNQAVCLMALGSWEEALDSFEQAAFIRRGLADAQPDEFLPALATTLNNQANCLADLGRLEEALEAIEQSLSIYRQFADAQPDDCLPGMAMALNNQTRCLHRLERPEEALEAIDQAANIYRQLAHDQPDSFLPLLAGTLNNQASFLVDPERRQEALGIIEQAVGIYRRLAHERPEAFLPDLAIALNNQATCLFDLGRPEEALEAIDQAADIYREFAHDQPAFLADLAAVLHNQSVYLAMLGRGAEALYTAEQTVAINRQLATERPSLFILRLVNSLNLLASVLSVLGRDAEAKAALSEAEAAMNSLETPAESAQDSTNE
jgi:tetratricopeptide (TPR) repeat protein